jgi:FMN phosphatase YigB (HAD superfamily)
LSDSHRPSAVLFDWRGTLVCDPVESIWLAAAAENLGRDLDAEALAEIEAALADAGADPGFRARMARAGCDRDDHRTLHLEIAAAAGLDLELATTLYELDFDPAFHPLFPDVPGTLAELHTRGLRICILSDIHFDLRPEFEAGGLSRYVDGFVLSFEHGTQKPDAEMFELALGVVGAAPGQTLMVGDDAFRDGGAAALGIATLLLPPLRTVSPRGLDMVLALTR